MIIGPLDIHHIHRVCASTELNNTWPTMMIVILDKGITSSHDGYTLRASLPVLDRE